MSEMTVNFYEHPGSWHVYTEEMTKFCSNVAHASTEIPGLVMRRRLLMILVFFIILNQLQRSKRHSEQENGHTYYFLKLIIACHSSFTCQNWLDDDIIPLSCCTRLLSLTVDMTAYASNKPWMLAMKKVHGDLQKSSTDATAPNVGAKLEISTNPKMKTNSDWNFALATRSRQSFDPAACIVDSQLWRSIEI